MYIEPQFSLISTLTPTSCSPAASAPYYVDRSNIILRCVLESLGDELSKLFRNTVTVPSRALLDIYHISPPGSFQTCSTQALPCSYIYPPVNAMLCLPPNTLSKRASKPCTLTHLTSGGMLDAVPLEDIPSAISYFVLAVDPPVCFATSNMTAMHGFKDKLLHIYIYIHVLYHISLLSLSILSSYIFLPYKGKSPYFFYLGYVRHKTLSSLTPSSTLTPPLHVLASTARESI